MGSIPMPQTNTPNGTLDMWLMTVSSWTAEIEGLVKRSQPARNIHTETQCYLARSRLDEGLRLLEDYSEALRRRYGPSATKNIGTVTEYRLLSVAQIPDDTDVGTLFELGVMEIDAKTIAAVDE